MKSVNSSKSYQPSSRTVLVIGATGTVGREVVRALREHPEITIRALVRSGTSLPGVEVVRGDLSDPKAVDRALAGVDAAFYVSPHETNEEAIAEGFVSSCERLGVRIVFAGVHMDGATRLTRALKRALFSLFLGHYGPKVRLAERIRRSSANPVVLVPSNFFQNDELFLDLTLQGSFVWPLRRINRVDVRDIGDAACRALIEPDFPAGAYPVQGPVSFSGEECASIFSNAIGRPVRYEPDRFEDVLSSKVSGKKRADFLASFKAIRKLSVPTNPRDVQATAALLQRQPRRYEDYVRELVAHS